MYNSFFSTNQFFKTTPTIGTNSKYNYLYKIINKSNGKYYYGIHTTKDLQDGYCGSGKLILRAYKKYGYQNFTKIILEFCKTPKSLKQTEIELLTPEILADDKCYNVQPGGGFQPIQTVTCIDTETGNHVRIPSEIYYSNRDRYISPTVGKIKAIDGTGKIFMAPVGDPRFQTGEIQDYMKILNKGTFPAYDTIHKKNIRVSINDPRLQTGEIIHVVKGKMRITKDGKDKFINKSELKIWEAKGWICGTAQKGKPKGPSKAKGKQHIWKIINGDPVVKVIDRSEFKKYELDGWGSGNGPASLYKHKKSPYKK